MPLTRPTDKQVQELKEKHGELYEISDETIFFLFQKPDRDNLSRFLKDSMKDSYRGLRNMIMDTVVYPTREEADKLFTEQPGIVIAIGTELQKLSGTQVDFVTRKI